MNPYKVIVLAADNNNFSVTATMLGTVPSNVTRIVKKQEEELGFLIFNRANNKLELTENGKLFVEHAREILQKEDEFYSNLEFSAHHRNVIRIGLCSYFTARLFKLHSIDFKKIHPDVRFIVVSKSNDEILRMLEHDLIDIAVVKAAESPYWSANFKTVFKFDLHAHFYTANKQYKNKRDVKADDGIFDNLVVPHTGSPMRSLIDNYFISSKRHMNPIVITNNIPVAFDSILNNNCTGVLFDEAVQNEHLGNVLFPINTENYNFNESMNFITNNSQNPIVDEYLDFYVRFFEDSFK